jgi:UPF0755 protein
VTLLRITTILFPLFLCWLFILAVSSIQQQARQTIGEPDASLDAAQLLFYEWTVFINQEKINQPSSLAMDKVVPVESGKSLADVISEMQTEGIISDADLFRKILIFTGADRRILPGKYLIPAGSSLRDTARHLQNASSSLIDFSILPGWRKEEIAAALPTSGLSISIDEFLTLVNKPLQDDDVFGTDIPSHEGFLAPGLYSFRRDVSVEAFVSAFIDESKRELTQDIRAAYAGHGLSVYQAVILASIVQREAVIDEEKPLIASVFLNRLARGMPLQSDPTAQYALGYSSEWGWWKSPLSLSDLEIESPYNTYIINGLPPSPISNPDQASLQAVANPQESTYLYFRAACDSSGRHLFANSIEEHTMNGCPDTGAGS